MEDGQLEIDGYRFGADSPWRVADWTTGDRSLLTQDTQRPGADGALMGRDWEVAPAWGFVLRTRGAQSPLVDAGGLREAWEGSRLSPGALSVLRYRIEGRTRRVYGRPRKWALFTTPHERAAGLSTADATFQLADPLHYSDVSGSVSLGIVPAVRSSWVFPMVPPFTWTVPGGAPQSRTAVVGGDVATPVRVTFQGPIVQPWVEVGGVRVETLGTLAFDEAVTVDARTMTVTRQDGASVPGFVAPRTRLAELRLPPGSHEITFGGTDVTGTATATVEWSDAWRSL